MDKYAVQTDPAAVKEAAEKLEPSCPACGSHLVANANVPKCPQCGTKPFESQPSK